MTPQFGASLTYDASSVNHDRNIFIMQATGNTEAEHSTQHPKIWGSNLGREKMAIIVLHTDSQDRNNQHNYNWHSNKFKKNDTQ